MYAIVDNKGKQYKVATGDEIQVDLIDVEEGELVQFDRVLMVGGDEGLRVGTPELPGARVLAEILRHEKVGLAAGASTPNWMTKRVIRRLTDAHSRRRNVVAYAACTFLRGLVNADVYAAGGVAAGGKDLEAEGAKVDDIARRQGLVRPVKHQRQAHHRRQIQPSFRESVGVFSADANGQRVVVPAE